MDILCAMNHFLKGKTMQHHALICSLYRINAVKFGDFTLKSGQSSKIYLDLRQIVSYPDVLRNVSEAMWEIVQHVISTSLWCSLYCFTDCHLYRLLQHNIPMIMRRKEKKRLCTRATNRREI